MYKIKFPNSNFLELLRMVDLTTNMFYLLSGEGTLQGIMSGSTGNYLMFREDTLQGIIFGSTGNYLMFREDTLQGIISGSTVWKLFNV